MMQGNQLTIWKKYNLNPYLTLSPGYSLDGPKIKI